MFSPLSSLSPNKAKQRWIVHKLYYTFSHAACLSSLYLWLHPFPSACSLDAFFSSHHSEATFKCEDSTIGASLVAQTVKNPPVMWETWVLSLGGEDPGIPTPVLLPGDAHGERSLVGYSPWGCKESLSSAAQCLVGCRISLCSAAPNPLCSNSPFIEWAGGYISLVWKPYEWWLLHFATYVWVFVIISDHLLLFLSQCNLDI